MKNKFLKGICYEPFPKAYNPSTANDTCIFFGSDIACYNMRPLWGDSFTPVDGPDAGKTFAGRNDIVNLAKMGVSLIRLYDWDAQNDHIPFLDYCHQFKIKVLVPVSNYNLGAFGPAPDMNESITGLIQSFTKNYDYHPAIYGITIGNELDQVANVSIDYVVQYTNQWAHIEANQFSTYRKVKIGHPVSFATNGPGWEGVYPCFGYLDKLIPPLISNPTHSLNKRLMLCPHTYNEASYLYRDAQGSGTGWVTLAYERYNLPILFCEIGCSRLTRPDYLDVIKAQIEESILYYPRHMNQLLGVCYFQYCDKDWCSGTSEGSFGLVCNTDESTAIVCYGKKDFHIDTGVSCANSKLDIQVFKENAAYKVVKKIYSGE